MTHKNPVGALRFTAMHEGHCTGVSEGVAGAINPPYRAGSLKP